MSRPGEYGFFGMVCGAFVGYVLGGVDGMYIGIIIGVQLVWIPLIAKPELMSVL